MTHLLVTGGGRGLGRALCDEGLARGWRVTATVRRAGTAPAGAAEIVMDVTDAGAIAALAGRVGPLDVLVNNAGIIGPAARAIGPLDPAAFLETFRVDTLAPLAVTQALLPCLRTAPTGRGRVLAISSQMSFMGYAKSDHIAYRAAKAALNKVMQGLATDLAAEGIAVVLIDPGWLRTDMGGPQADLEPAEVARAILSVAGGLDMSRSGQFLRHDGTRRDF
ncbi:SDR family NAD(P)-dependent oxidoreductase [Paracoccus subflavus]|uniref:SDR family NAD(P)-dependent oxidoreductase n=1 Tax=Paracoccus subflavus TaxID=2528244 RepID=A0A4Q9G7X6_9RHOB|nr:SDR family NAD(P)-dependent oxidoreductase [Paracoccus subflavus]TBN42020.1 SDR family NAD(P)-dependent oxidoreductase [Paracoccus subflavus]